MRSSSLAALISLLLLGVTAGAGAQQYPPAVTSAPRGGTEATSAATDSAEAAARRAAESWLALVDRKQYAVSWDSAATLFQRAGTPAQWAEAVRQVREQAGPLESRSFQRSQVTTTLGNFPPGEYAILQYHTATGGRAVGETVIMQNDGARGWRLAAYLVRPG